MSNLIHYLQDPKICLPPHWPYSATVPLPLPEVEVVVETVDVLVVVETVDVVVVVPESMALIFVSQKEVATEPYSTP